jgi:pyruvate carboxylase
MVRESGAIAEAAVCYTGNIDDPSATATAWATT